MEWDLASLLVGCSTSLEGQSFIVNDKIWDVTWEVRCGVSWKMDNLNFEHGFRLAAALLVKRCTARFMKQKTFATNGEYRTLPVEPQEALYVRLKERTETQVINWTGNGFPVATLFVRMDHRADPKCAFAKSKEIAVREGGSDRLLQRLDSCVVASTTLRYFPKWENFSWCWWRFDRMA